MTEHPASVEIRTDNRLTEEHKTATPADAKQLHEWPDVYPDSDDPITVAVMDSGIHQDAVDNHPWFDRVPVKKRYDATGEGTGGDEVGHGTGVASIYGRLGGGVLPSAPPLEFYDVRIFGKSGRTGFQTIADAYRWMIDHASEIDIANLSWGARSDVPAINRLHEQLVDAGVHDVVAAGNTGAEGGSPATSRKAFSAGAVDENGDLTRFTSRNPNQDNPDVAAIGKNNKMARAPGTSMGSPINDEFTKASGTSFAAPVTGAAYVLAYAAEGGSWDRAFEKAAVDIPGSKADGEGLLRLTPALDGSAATPSADAHVLKYSGTSVIYLDAGWIPDGKTVASKVGETKDDVTVEFET